MVDPLSDSPRNASAPKRNGDAEEEPRRPGGFTDTWLQLRSVRCWRCEKTVQPRLGRCPYCRAALETLPEERIVLPVKEGLNPIFKVVGLMVALMAVALVTFLVLRAKHSWMLLQDWQELRLQAMLIAEGLTTTLVLFGFVWIGRLPGLPRPDWNWRLAAWLWALPVLALLIGMNLGYFWLLRQYLPPQLRDDWPLTPLVILIVCVQPAVIEELFFRQLALTGLRQHMGLHGAVWITSVMFGLHHIGNPFGIPYLIVLGAGLGYARVVSGGLALPMLMHGLHNFVVLYLHNVL
jgi:membrane protease YdiL (CAAX protease family)